MKTLNLFFLLLACVTGATHAQGTLVYDQESFSGVVYPFGGIQIQGNGSVGQSFTPSLSTVAFVRFDFTDRTPGNAIGATLVVNLRSNAINGPILGTTTPVVFSDGFTGSVAFFFASAIPVATNTPYYFETFVQSGDSWGITTLYLSDYSGGDFYLNSAPAVGTDLWFTEGTIVPEPTVVSVLFLGSGMAAWFLRQKKLCLH